MSDHQPNGVLAELSFILALVYRSIEEAVTETRSYMGGKIKPPDQSVFAALVRWNTLLRLEASRGNLFELQSLSNCGLLILRDRYSLRIWKDDEGELPAPGRSHAKREYYSQPIEQMGFPWATIKLAVIWGVNEHLTLRPLLLVCPSGADESWAPGQSHWEIEIPHPATLLVPLPLPSDPDDLDLQLVPGPDDDRDEDVMTTAMRTDDQR